MYQGLFCFIYPEVPALIYMAGGILLFEGHIITI